MPFYITHFTPRNLHLTPWQALQFDCLIDERNWLQHYFEACAFSPSRLSRMVGMTASYATRLKTQGVIKEASIPFYSYYNGEYPSLFFPVLPSSCPQSSFRVKYETTPEECVTPWQKLQQRLFTTKREFLAEKLLLGDTPTAIEYCYGTPESHTRNLIRRGVLPHPTKPQSQPTS